MSAHKKITAARTSLVLEQPFFGTLALSLSMREDSSCPTAWVDGRTLGYNPAFIESLTHEQRTALVAHEVMHCAMGHPWRRDARSAKHWNIACDKAINRELRESGFTLPPDALYPDGDEIGKSAEWIFARMRQSDKPQPDPNGNQSGNGGSAPGQGTGNNPDPDGDGQGGDGAPDPLGEVRDAPLSDSADGPAPTEEDWKQKTMVALQAAKGQGLAPGGLIRAVKDAVKPRVDIRSLLLRFFSERSTADYSWTRPNPRYMSQGLYLPSLDSRDLGEVAIMVDTSGSIDETALQYARSIVESVIDECQPASVTVYYADAEVCRVDRFEKGEPLTWEPAGGGGTDFRPALEAIETDGTAVCALCITDLKGTFPDLAPSMPVIWLATADHTAPFGETVPVDY